MNRGRNHKPVRRVLTAAAAFWLGGCAIAPKPLTIDERRDFAANVAANVIRPDQEPVGEPIDLYEAMARAIKYNLDQRVELMEAALRSREADVADWSLLPQLVASAGYSGRSNFSGASSSALLGKRQTGAQSLVSSTSSERQLYTADLQASWNILDFGLSYVRAKQANDEYLIALEQRRRIINQIVQEVRSAYWRAVSAQRLLGRIGALETDVEEALKESRALVERRKTPPLAALTYQRELLSVKREVQELHRELVIAKAQLAALMNIPPNQEFSLLLPERASAPAQEGFNVETLVSDAFVNRPEMRELIYRLRINDKERKAVLLELLPSLEAYGGANYDSNDFLFNSNWLSWGAHVSWNVIQAFRTPARQKEIGSRENLIRYQTYALGMAIMTQVNVAVWRYKFFRSEYETAQEYAGVQSKIVDAIRARARAEAVSRQTLIREEMNNLLAEIRYDIAFADLQNAFAMIYATSGVDPYGDDVTGDENVDALAASLRRVWARRGDTTINEEAGS